MIIDKQRLRGVAASLKSAPNLALIVQALAALALILLVAGSPAEYVYDEHAYLEGAWLLKKGFSFHELLVAPLNTPAGPLYATTHWMLSPLTGLHAPAIRWPNLVLFVLGTAACAYALSLWRFDCPWMRAAMLLALPIFWVTTGMALTEIAAFAFSSFCLAATAWGMTAPEGARTRLWSGFVLGALCLGIAVLGRQPYLPAVGGFVMIALFAPRFRWPAALAAAIAFAVPLPVFLLWGGLVAPSVARVGGFSLYHGALAFAYLSVLILILAPAYFLDRWKWSLAAGIAVGAIVVLAGSTPPSIGQGVAAHLPPLVAHMFQPSIAAAMAGGGASLIVASGANMWSRRDDLIFLLMVLLMLGLTSTAAAIVHIFSSRYLMTAFPFALFAVQPFFKPSRWAVARLALGAFGGYLSLANYLH